MSKIPDISITFQPISHLITLAYQELGKFNSKISKRSMEDILNSSNVQISFANIQNWFQERKSSLELDPPERILVLVLFYSFEESQDSPKIEALGEFLGLSSNLEILKLTDAVNYFQKQGIIRAHRYIRNANKRGNSLLANFFIEPTFLTALINNKLFTYDTNGEKVTDLQLIRKSTLILEKMDMESSYNLKEGLIDFISLIRSNKHLALVKKLEEHFNEAEFGMENEEMKIMPPVNQLVTIFLLSRAYRGEPKFDIINKFEDIFGVHLTLQLVHEFESGEHVLIVNDFLKISPSMHREHMSLNIEVTPKLMRHFLPESSTIEMQFERLKFITPIEAVKPENDFYYPDDIKENLTFIEELLKHNHPNLKVYLSGAPGTGKTSFVNALAHKTNRMLFISKQVKSMWFGESQQNLEQMFDEIENIITRIEKPPIFFIDESDRLLGSRMSGSDMVISTLNELQAILLQRIEKYKGLLVCCSNFPISYMDPAFERRFDLIIEMKSSYESRYQMLKQRAKLEGVDITKQEIQRLASFENFQPGLIDLVFRKAKLNLLINKKFDFVKEVEARINKSTSHNVISGFVRR